MKKGNPAFMNPLRPKTGAAHLKILKRSLEALTAASLTTVAIHAWADPTQGNRRDPAFASAPEILRAQLQNDIMGTIEKNRSAKTFGTYGTSGYTAKDVFSNVQALRDPNAWLALCQTLDTLPAESLALFEAEIQKPEIDQVMSCTRGLRDKLTRFWHENETRFRQHLAVASKRAHPTKPTPAIVDERKISVSESPIVVRGDLKDSEIALTFNDGPHPTRTARILDILKAAGVRATYFHVGELIKTRPELDHRLVDEKHTLGTHSFGHSDLSRHPLKKAEQLIVKGRDEAEAATGLDAPFFRFPYGLMNDELKDILKQRKMPSFLWNMDSQDWKIREASTLYDHILHEIDREKGGVLVLHDNLEQTVIVLPALLNELKARGFTFVVFVPTF